MTLAELKYKCTKIHYFGLGFIQVKMELGHRIHVYDPTLPSIMPDEEIHNHRSGFRSVILGGILVQSIYRMSAGNSSICKMVSCDPLIPDPSDLGFETHVHHYIISQYVPGSAYELSANAFHRVKAGPDGCITQIQQLLPRVSEYASVIRPIGAPAVCPFSQVIPESELWDRVETMWSKLIPCSS